MSDTLATRGRISLTRYLIEHQRGDDGRKPLPPALRLLIEVVARACKQIAHEVGKGALGGVLGEAGTGNVQGEAQKKLDVIANEILLEANEWGGHLAAMASEEMATVFPIPDRYPRGEYLLLFDPLDGSSNIDVNVSIGTIFSVLACAEGSVQGEEAFLQAGHRQVAAGYAVYGPQTQLVLTVGHGVAVFTLDRETHSWILTDDNVRIPEDTKEFAINMSNRCHWDAPVTRYVDELLAGKARDRWPRTSTCAGSRRWWPMSIASSRETAYSCTPAMRVSPRSPASCGCSTKPVR